MKTIGVIFLSKELTSKSGNKYFSGKMEGSEEFNLMGFIKESKSGTKYMSLVRTDLDESGEVVEKTTSDKPMFNQKPQEKKVVDNTETIIDPSDLPF